MSENTAEEIKDQEEISADICNRLHTCTPDVLGDIMLIVLHGMARGSDGVVLMGVCAMNGANEYRKFMISQGVDVLAIEDKFMAENSAESEDSDND